MHVFLKTLTGLRGFLSDKEVTQNGKAFADSQRTNERCVEAGLKAMKSQ